MRTSSRAQVARVSFSFLLAVFFYFSTNSARVDSSVDKNPSLSDVDHFNYLHNLVEGQAIARLLLTVANYKAALKEIFGQKRIIINCQMENLVKIQLAYSSTDIRKVRMLYDAIEQNCKAAPGTGSCIAFFWGSVSTSFTPKFT